MDAEDSVPATISPDLVLVSAIALADSGQCSDFTDILYVLRYEQGWTDACWHLETKETRRMLNQRCADARELTDAGLA